MRLGSKPQELGIESQLAESSMVMADYLKEYGPLAEGDNQ